MEKILTCKRIILSFLLFYLLLSQSAFAQSYIVEQGTGRAQIIIKTDPPRMVDYAAQELQEYIYKISGVTLPINTTPDPNIPNIIYIGKSTYTDNLGLSDTGLDDGAYTIVSGTNWLALLGKDSDFAPTEPWAHTSSDRTRVLADWDLITGNTFGNPLGMEMYRHYNSILDAWDLDERGSLNAVHDFLRSLGVKWYMPGDLGEIVPSQATITIPSINDTKHPVFGLRNLRFASYYSVTNEEHIKWFLRMGLNQHSKETGIIDFAHGTKRVIERDEMKIAHPEYYALIGGVRATATEKSCLSSTGHFSENLNYLRKMFDQYDNPMHSVMPEDGYTNFCECPLCQGKDTPSRGDDGFMSDYAWDYVNRIAAELYTTHPSKKINCFAYGGYRLPPQNISLLNSNIVVGITEHRRDFNDTATKQLHLNNRTAWLSKIQTGKLIIWNYYPFTEIGENQEGLPAYFPHVIAEDLKSLENISFGEYIEVPAVSTQGNALHAPIFNHLNVYVSAHLYWDVDQDVDTLLNQYYQDFYGPGANEMKAFVEYCEQNWQSVTTDINVITQVLYLFDQAKAAIGSGTDVYAQRIQLLNDYIKHLYLIKENLLFDRQDVEEIEVSKRNVADLVLDGNITESFWFSGMHQYLLKESETGRDAVYETSFKTAWLGDAVCIGIRCTDWDTNNFNIPGAQDDDLNILNGDVVELLLEVQGHSYFHIAIDPAGHILDIDKDGGDNVLWSSDAQLAVSVDDTGWGIEILIPAWSGGSLDLPDNITSGLPGWKPTKLYPWYINVCRQRVRGNKIERTAFSPTGLTNFHIPKRFGRMVVQW